MQTRFIQPRVHLQFFVLLVATLLRTADVRGQEVVAEFGPNVLINNAVIPDQSICILSQQPLRFISAQDASSVLFEGQNFGNARAVKKVLQPSGQPNSYDQQYAAIGGIVRLGNEIVAVYHAEKPTGGKNEFGVSRFYASIGIAVSKDNGNTFQKLGPAITGRPEDAKWKGTAQGNGDPTLCVDHTGKWLLCYYTEHSRSDPLTKEKRSVITCVARSPISEKGRPGTWKKYYDGQFDEPGLGGKDSQVMNCWAPNVTYLGNLKRYIIVGNRGAVGFASSSDGLKWSKPTPLLSVDDLPVGEFAWHPSLHIETTTKQSASGYVLYGYSPDGKSNPVCYGMKITLTLAR